MKTIDKNRYLWCMRAFVLFAVVALIVNLSLYQTITSINAKPRVQAFFIQTVDRDSQLLFVEGESNLGIAYATRAETLARNLIMKYVIARESLYLDSSINRRLRGRGSDVAEYSSPELWQEFQQSPNFRESLANPRREIRTVKIDPNDVRYYGQGGYWEVTATIAIKNEFGLNERLEKRTIRLSAGFDEGNMTRGGASAFRNPLGFRVSKYRYEVL